MSDTDTDVSDLVPGEPYTTPEYAAREAGIDPQALLAVLESGAIQGEKLDEGRWLVPVSEALRARDLPAPR